MNKCLAFFLFAAAAIPNVSTAQCGGINVGGGNCVPPTAPGMPQGPSDTPNGGSRPAAARWADRWGAFVMDKTTGDAGGVIDQLSRKAAIAAATHDCEITGATHCELIVAYYNQCAAIAITDNEMGSGRAPTEDQAKELALHYCGSSTQRCKIEYSACARAQRID